MPSAVWGVLRYGGQPRTETNAPGREREPPPGALYRKQRWSKQPTGCGASPNCYPISNYQQHNRRTQLRYEDARAQRLAWKAAVRTPIRAETPPRRSNRTLMGAEPLAQQPTTASVTVAGDSVTTSTALHSHPVHIAPLRPASNI